MKRLVVRSLAVLIAFALAHAVRADVAQPEGEMPTCEVPGITIPRDRPSALELASRISASAESSRPSC